MLHHKDKYLFIHWVQCFHSLHTIIGSFLHPYESHLTVIPVLLSTTSRISIGNWTFRV